MQPEDNVLPWYKEFWPWFIIGMLSFSMFVSYILAAVAAFGTATLGIKVMRGLASDTGYSCFAYYCWGLALFTFIMNLLA